jgi:hypothetical protein
MSQTALPLATAFMRLDPATEPPPTLPARRNPRVLLEIRRGAARHRLRPVLGPVYLIGTSAECDLVLADPQFPEIHAYLLVSDEGVLLRYLGIGPEITVDGRPVEAVQLLDGDRLRTGPFEFRVHIGAGPTGPGAKAAFEKRPRPTAWRRPSTLPPSPAALVRALLAEVRARLALSEVPLAQPPLSSQHRDAA